MLKLHFSTPKMSDFLILNRDKWLRQTKQLIDCNLNTTFDLWGNSFLEKGKYLVIESSLFLCRVIKVKFY